MSNMFCNALEVTVDNTRSNISDVLTLSNSKETLLKNRKELKAKLKKIIENLDAIDDISAILEIDGIKFFGKE